MTNRSGNVPLLGGRPLGVDHMRCSGGQLLETRHCKDNSSEERWYLTPGTWGSLGTVYMASLGSSKQTSKFSPDL